MIQLSYGLEFEQPAIIAEGLAQTATHKARFNDLFARIEAAAEATDQTGQEKPAQRPLTEICETLHSAHSKLATSVRWSDDDFVFDGIMARAGAEAIALCSQIRVNPAELEERTAEMLHNAAYITAGASLHPPHIPKYDFIFV